MIIKVHKVVRGSIIVSITKLHKGEFVYKGMNFRQSDNFIKKFEIFKKLNFIDFEKDKRWKTGDMNNRGLDRNYLTSRGDKVTLMSYYNLRYLRNNFDKMEKITLKDFWDLLHFYHDKWFKEERYHGKARIINSTLRVEKTYIIVEEENESI